MVNKKMDEYDDLHEFPSVDSLYMCFHARTSSGWLVLDEIDNYELIRYIHGNLTYAIEIDKELNRQVFLLCIDDWEQYFSIKENFPKIKVIGVYGNTQVDYIPSKDIKDHYDQDNNGCTFAAFHTDDILSPDILGFFTHSCYYVHNYCKIDYHIELPDLSAYNKLILLLGGRDLFYLYHVSRNHR